MAWATASSDGVVYGKKGRPPQSPRIKKRVLPSSVSFPTRSYRPRECQWSYCGAMMESSSRITLPKPVGKGTDDWSKIATQVITRRWRMFWLVKTHPHRRQRIDLWSERIAFYMRRDKILSSEERTFILCIVICITDKEERWAQTSLFEEKGECELNQVNSRRIL